MRPFSTRILLQTCLLFATLLAALPAWSDQDIFDFSIRGEARLRYEHASQDDLPENADGLTQLIRVAAETSLTDRVSALIEGEAIFAFVDEFDDGSGNAPDRPVIADPNSLELNRAQLQVALTDKTFLTLGRQRVAIDDQRFLGPVA
ncbi:MAG: hypothetical protein AAGJ50_06585, partial [Pseudomonadota bacterium]